MREHPIPQDVTGYKFHIVGNMTLKQFAEVGFGVVGAIIINTTNLPDIIKWGLMLLSAGLGAAVAFLPIEERPLDHWIMTFFKILYNPTQFYWRRQPRVPDLFTYESVINPLYQPGDEIDLSPAKRQRIQDYLISLRPNSGNDAWDDYELQRSQLVLQSFNDVTVPNTSVQTQKTNKTSKPNLTVRVRQLKQSVAETSETTVFAQTTAPHVFIQQTTQPTAEYKKVGLQTNSVAQEISVPETNLIAVEPTFRTTIQEEIATQTTASDRAFLTNDALVASQSTAQTQVTTNTKLPFPTMPTEPNKIVGMVLGPNNELIADAIVEIKNTTGQIVRAVKTNMLSQFFVATPLPAGNYIVDVEKANYSFSSQNLVLSDQILAPLELRASVNN